MRIFFRYAFGGLLLVTVAMASMMITMRFAIHGREVAVPKLTGLLPSEAERVANQNGLLLSRENRFYSDTIPEGRVVSQLPPAGERVRRGWRVRVAESLGPQRIVIPSVLGQSPRAAELNVRRRGLDLGSIASINLPGLPPDEVIAQSPPPDAQGIATPKVSLLVSAPEAEKAFVMPDLVGMKLSEASVSIVDAGLKVGKVSTQKTDTSAAPANGAAPKKGDSQPVIATQVPAAGQRVTPGVIVNLEVVR